MAPHSAEAIRQSFTWWSFAKPGTNPDDLLRSAAAVGYEAVELLPIDLWPRAKDVGLAVSAMNGHASIEAGLNRRGHHDRIVREIHENVRLAERWNVPNLICFSGNRAGRTDAEGALVTIEGLRRAAPVAEAAGVTLVLELLNSKVDHPDYQCDTSAWGLNVVRAVNSPSVKLLYDVYHAQVMEGNIIATIRENAGDIGHYHTAGVPGRHDLDDAQEIYYPEVLRAIHDTGYRGFVAHEFVPKGDPALALRGAFDLTRTSVV
ncbi:hydroxypyruvate isomerase family protein [Deinococcus yavapaiensis]|uniref:Hydroxypyruvate isomerase n=1 Tax=Deinococcus yavapaiensis KR-236 TaxID=694435 RepID=A0A318SB37_9DEIO|nr:TIM barrel protein [Deinococcus yavapaiensis]PYE53839.1 hydroxypyruvate isomerase [Deinococcus yavapaiensis KR-236]